MVIGEVIGNLFIIGIVFTFLAFGILVLMVALKMGER